MSGSSFFRVDATDHLGFVFEGLLGLEGALDEGRGTWLPVIPWQMTLVCLLTQTLGTVENRFLHTLLSIKYLYCYHKNKGNFSYSQSLKCTIVYI